MNEIKWKRWSVPFLPVWHFQMDLLLQSRVINPLESILVLHRQPLWPEIIILDKSFNKMLRNGHAPFSTRAGSLCLISYMHKMHSQYLICSLLRKLNRINILLQKTQIVIIESKTVMANKKSRTDKKYMITVITVIMLVLPLINFAVPLYSHFRLGATKEQLVENELNFFFIIRNSRDTYT